MSFISAKPFLNQPQHYQTLAQQLVQLQQQQQLLQQQAQQHQVLQQLQLSQATYNIILYIFLYILVTKLLRQYVRQV